jgi:hypothetical protein
MTEYQRFILIDVTIVVASAFLLILLLVRIRSRRRRARFNAIAAEMQLQTKADIERRDKAAKEHMDHVFGRKALWRREMAQRELDRFYGKLPADSKDPSYKEWTAARGLPTEDVDEVPQEVSTE